jgi:hypothetical protein
MQLVYEDLIWNSRMSQTRMCVQLVYDALSYSYVGP